MLIKFDHDVLHRTNWWRAKRSLETDPSVEGLNARTNDVQAIDSNASCDPTSSSFQQGGSCRVPAFTTPSHLIIALAAWARNLKLGKNAAEALRDVAKNRQVQDGYRVLVEEPLLSSFRSCQMEMGLLHTHDVDRMRRMFHSSCLPPLISRCNDPCQGAASCISETRPRGQYSDAIAAVDTDK